MNNTEIKSKVMSLGNRLTSQMGGDRSAAFVRAWVIVKASGLELAVKGVSMGNRQEALRRLNNYNPLQIRAFLMPEPENPVDANAIAVMVGINGGRGYYKLGYVPVSDTGIAAAVHGKVSIRVLAGDIRGARLIVAV